MTSSTDTIEIRNGRRAGHVFVIAVQLGFGALFGGIALKRLLAGVPAGELTFPLLAGIGILAAGLYQLHQALNRAFQVTLSPDGLRDNRTGGVLIPWAMIKKVAHLPTHGSGTASVRLELSQDLDVGGHVLLTGSGNHFFSKDKIMVEIGTLDTNACEFIRHIRRFAPHVEIEPLFAPRR